MINVLLPMSGLGSRFVSAGYKLPKPLIDVNGKPMIQRVIENIRLKANYIFIVLKEHNDNYELEEKLKEFCYPNSCKVIITDTITEGAACSCLLAKEFINNSDKLIIANSDQIVECKIENFISDMTDKNADGGIITFIANEDKWSFVKIEEGSGLITEVAEKVRISHYATAGVYFWSKGYDFVKSAEQMIDKNIRTRNEYYLAPSYNELIQSGHKIYSYQIEKMQGLGVPSDLLEYLSKNK